MCFTAINYSSRKSKLLHLNPMDAIGIIIISKHKIMYKVLAPSTIYNPHINSYGLMEALDTFMCPRAAG